MNKSRYRILLVEPSEIVASGFKGIAESTGEFSVVASISSLSEKSSAAVDADLFVVNPLSEGFDNLEKFKSANDGSFRIVILAHENYPERFTEGFDGVISIYDTKAKAIRKLRSAVAGQTGREDNACELSSREKEIISAVAKGLTNKEIAERYCISVNTVITHRRNISTKLGINTISGLTVYAVIHGLIEL